MVDEGEYWRMTVSKDEYHRRVINDSYINRMIKTQLLKAQIERPTKITSICRTTSNQLLVNWYLDVAVKLISEQDTQDQLPYTANNSRFIIQHGEEEKKNEIDYHMNLD